MKPSVIIALVVVGGVVIITPVIAEYLLNANHQENLVRILEKGAQRVTLEKGEISGKLTFGCWFSGSLMVVSGIILAFRPPAHTSSE